MLILISAVAANRAIGFRGGQPFTIAEDLHRFRRLTEGHTVVMGRRTFEALPHGALPRRRNIVLTRRPDFSAPGVEAFSSLADALAACSADEDIYIIGGGEVYAAALPLAERLHITHIHADAPDADTFFPDIPLSDWRITHSEHHPAADGNPAYTFVDYER